MNIISVDALSSLSWSATTFIAGIASKSLIDSYFRRKEESRKFVLDKRVKFLEQQLSQFYWPIYLHLQKDNLIWERLKDRDQDPESNSSRLSQQIESGVILPNHKEALAVIETNLHLAGDAKVVAASLRYVRHVKVYEMLRAAGIKSDPINFGEAYPSDFFPLIDERVHTLQAEYDKLIRQSQAG
jgi:S1-C subfamily serine protease